MVTRLFYALFTLGAAFAPLLARAECVPDGKQDACAPAKKVGEWEKSAQFGFNMTKGNSETTLMTVGANANYDDGNNIWKLSGMYGYGEDKNLDDPEYGDTLRNDLRTSIKYDNLISDRSYLGMGSNFLYDDLAEVDYRVTLDPNIGYFILRDNSFKFKVEGGPSYVFERVAAVNNDYLAARAGQRFEWAITCTSKLYEQAELLLDTSDTNNYIVNAEAGVEAALATNLALVFTARETYDNQPAPDREKSDLALITSLKVLL